MLTLDNLKTLRLSQALSREALSNLSRISPTNLRNIENKRAEPWLHEAISIARIFGCPVSQLITADHLTKCAMLSDDDLAEADLRRWRRGDILPLTSGYRIAYRFGLSDPAQLTASEMVRQVVDTLLYAERLTDASQCAWCGSEREQGHSDTCLAFNLYGGSNAPLLGSILVPGSEMRTPKRTGAKRGGGAMGRGLKGFRYGRHVTQQYMAEKMQISVPYYSDLERCIRPLLHAHAERLSDIFNEPTSTFYLETVDASTLPDRVRGDKRRVKPIGTKAERRKAWLDARRHL